MSSPLQVVPNLSPMLVAVGLKSSPKARLTAFYQKHNPKKMQEVDTLLAKYASDYKPMIKRLEARSALRVFFR